MSERYQIRRYLRWRALPALVAAALCAWPSLARAQGSAAQSHEHEPSGDVREYPSLNIAGFGDVNFFSTKHPEGPRGFNLGQFVLHMTSELSPRVTFFGEISLSARADAGTGSPAATGFNTEVERMILRFDYSDQLKVSFGRYHTPINWWNTAFHHGQWLQTTIARPEMIQFGGRFLPVHFVGALVEGTTPAGGLNIGYQGGIGNGRSSVLSRAGDPGDNNDKRAYLANVFVKPNWAFGLQMGGSVYKDTITLTNARVFDERILGAHVAWQRENPELIAEFASVRHEEAGNPATTNNADHVQAAYRLPEPAHLWKPYFRFEHIGVDANDAVFTTAPQTVLRLDGSTVGVRYDISLYAAVKGEYRTWTRGEGTVRNHGGFFQVCFTF